MKLGGGCWFLGGGWERQRKKMRETNKGGKGLWHKYNNYLCWDWAPSVTCHTWPPSRMDKNTQCRGSLICGLPRPATSFDVSSVTAFPPIHSCHKGPCYPLLFSSCYHISSLSLSVKCRAASILQRTRELSCIPHHPWQR